MSTPIGHALAGYAVSTFQKEGWKGSRLEFLFLCMLAAVAPDLDILPGLLVGRPVLFHGGITHSLGMALAVSLAVAGVMWLWKRPFWFIFKFCLVAYVTHLILDFVGPDGRAPYGIPVLWPLGSDHFLSPVPILPGVHHVRSTFASTSAFIQGVISPYNLVAVALEAIVILPFAVLGKRYPGKKWKHSTEPADNSPS